MTIRLRVMSPGYSGFAAQYVDALLRLRRLCGEQNIQFWWTGVSHLADIVSVRNEIARIFMEGDSTHLLMVDGDIGFDPADVMKMIGREVDFAVGAPPARDLRISMAIRAAEAGEKNPEAKASRFFVNPLPEDVGSGRLTLDEQGFAQIDSIGGAFMLLRRGVFERLAKTHPELQYSSVDGRPAVSYFEGGIVDGVRLGEDRMFCRRWRQIGGKIHLLPDATMTHTGPSTFTGNFARFAGLPT